MGNTRSPDLRIPVARMPTARQDLGERGEKAVAQHIPCPRCNKRRHLTRLPNNFQCADVICRFCGYLAQVKAVTMSEGATEHAVREVEILDRDVLAMLREHRLASLHSGDGDYVFATATGRPINARNLVTRGLDKAMNRVGLNGGGKPKLTWHDLRRTAGSMQVAAGYSPEYIARQMGHTNSAITLRIYSQEFDRRRDGERRREEYRARYGGIIAGTSRLTSA